MDESLLEGIAIIAVHGRFPGAGSVEEFWSNLVAGRESISFFSDAELIESGLDPSALRSQGHYVPARGILQDAEFFDAAFFGIHPKEAEILDPQQRVFLEACWEALERAGHAPGRVKGSVGIYAGATFNTYYLHALHPRPDLRELVGPEQVMLGNERDYLATRVAYKLNLRGPALSLNTACSSSLVAVCQACQALLTFQCDLALAGGVSVTVPQRRGYFHQEGNIGSPDGHTRSFDAAAQGTAFGNGVTVVVLKRLAEALEDGDPVIAVIKGVALNNDGAQRVSFGAPGVEGQSEVISLAHAVAGVDADSIAYVEAHGTATPLGDPIEVAALTRAFRRTTARTAFCALGSVKSNIGHLDAAAGTAGLIKTALALQHRLLPPTLHFHTPNPKLDLDKSPFFVNAAVRELRPEGGVPLRAGVSSFGTGGTNAHVILEEAPAPKPGDPSRPWKLLLLSAKTADALETASRNLSGHLASHPDLDLADVAFTLQVGRSEFMHRRSLVCRDTAEAIAALEKPDARRVYTARQDRTDPPVAFLFPGQGAQYVMMGAELYRQERVFREVVDECAGILRSSLGWDLREILFAGREQEERASEQLRQTRFTQPALFTIETALARQWMAWGIRPAAMMGHSVGEYVAAHLAGVFTLADALMLVAHRAELVQTQPHGSMLAVRMGQEELETQLEAGLAIAAVNAAQLCVVAGPDDAISRFEEQLRARGVAAKRLSTSHAFHSAMMDPVVAPFTERLRRTRFAPPTIPFVSNVTGRWVAAEDAASPDYWARHVRQTVRFSEGLGELAARDHPILLEVGPGQTLTQLARQHPGRQDNQPVLASLGPSRDQELPNFLSALGRLWVAGATIDWKAYYGDERRRRVVLPTYPFDRKRYWPETPVNHANPPAAAAPMPVSLAAGAVTPSPSGSSPTPPSTALPADGMPGAMPPAPAPAPRREHLLEILRGLLQELSGSNLDAADPAVTFLELGLDSLLLTQAATLFQRRFGVPVSFRQLMEDLLTPGSLADYLDEKLPPDAFRPAAAVLVPAPQAPAASIAPGGASTAAALEHLLEQQVQIHAQLLAMVRGQGPAALPTAGRPLPVPQAGVDPASVSGAPAVRAASTPPAGAPGETRSHGPFRPLDRGPVTGLTAEQQQWLDGLIQRYTHRTAGSKRLASQNRAVLADPRTVSGFKQLWKEMVYPIYTERSDGARVWDVDGNEYIDFVMGFGASLFGHRPPFVLEAIRRQLELGFEIGPIQPMVGEAAALVRELTGMERVAFCNTGSEAVLGAIRIARTVTGRDTIAMFSGAYHGIFDEVLARPLTVNGEVRAAPIAPGIPMAGTSQMKVFDWGNPESLELIRACGHELAAVLVEPVQSRRLDLQPREFLLELRRITEATGTALIFDEVVTGFRVHPGGAQAYYGIRADIATYGKVIGGGLPIGLVAGRPRFLDALDGGAWKFGDTSFPEVGVTFFAGTFVRHPITIAVARAVLEHLRREGPALQEGVAELAAKTAGRLREVITRFGAPLHVAQFSSMLYLTVQSAFRHGALLFYLLRERGIHIWENRAFVFTTAHTDADAERMVQAVEDSLADLAKAGFLPGRQLEGKATGMSVAAPPGPGASTSREVRHDPREYELTEAQREVWLASLLDDRASQSYNITFLLHLHGPLNVAALEASLRAWIDRHDSLRTSFDRVSPVQRVAPTVDLSLRVEVREALSAAERSAEVERLARGQSETPFDIGRAPLIRLLLVRFPAGEDILILTFNHLVVDGWSAGVLLHELKLLYAAGCDGRLAGLEAALQFASYHQHLASAACKEARASAEAYWRSAFAALPPPLDLPTDRLRPPQRSFRAERVTVRWEPEFHQALKKTSARQGTTLLTFLLAGFKVLLHRLSGQEDLVVGVPAAGQLSAPLEPVAGSRALVGHCVNLLPVRSRCGPDLSFREFLKALKRSLLDAFEHQDLSFGRLVELLRVPRDASRVPLVPVLFNLDRAVAGFELSGLRTDIEEFPRSSLVFDLSVNVIDNDHDLRLDCDFSTDLFDAGTIRRWLQHFRKILESAMANPDEKLTRLRMLSDEDLDQMTREWNDTRMAIDGPMTLPELVEAQVARTPDATAVIWNRERLTYRELNQSADRLAGHLRGLGVGPESLVGVCMRRSADMIVGMLAILKAGGGYVPLDPKYPRERIQFMLEDTSAAVVLAEHDTEDLLSGQPGATVVLLDGFDWQTKSPTPRTEPGVTPQNLAYVIYTSGSTGVPKGVAIEHRSAAVLVHWALGVFAPDELAGVLFSTSICFDLSVFELFVTLSGGGAVIVAENALALPELAARREVTLINTVPSAITELLRKKAIPSGVRVVNLAGEPLQTAIVDRLHALGFVRKVYDLYGPSEDTTYSTCALRQAGMPATIGRPIANTQVYLLDPHGQPVPIGVPGEIHIGGDGLARGYLHRPELTAEKFLPHPFDSRPGARVYRTGDWARYRADGSIEFLGRMDQQVKLRGFRIEIGEIESVLGRDPDVRQCAVVVRNRDQGERQLVAYVEPHEGRQVVAADLRARIRNTLPEYMVPQHFVVLDRLPLTANRKIDRKALPAPEEWAENRSRAPAVADPPVTATERTLASLWSDLLECRQVSRTSDFFDLGGHSLLAVRLFDAIEKGFGRKLPLATILRSPTLSDLAAVIDGTSGTSVPWRSLVAVRPTGKLPPLFCVHGGGGEVLFARDLIRHLPAEQPFYALQARAVTHMADRDGTVEAMAEHYLEELLSVQRSGPFHLSGFCMGGLVAYEMAQRLLARREEVRLVVLIDTYNPIEAARAVFRTSRWSRWCEKVAFHWGNIVGLHAADMLTYTSARLRKMVRYRSGRLAARLSILSRRLRRDETTPEESRFLLEDFHDQVGMLYRPRPLAANVLVVRPQKFFRGFDDPCMGWASHVTGRLEVANISVNPGGMFVEPYVGMVGDRLTEALTRARPLMNEATDSIPHALLRPAVQTL